MSEVGYMRRENQFNISPNAGKLSVNANPHGDTGAKLFDDAEQDGYVNKQMASFISSCNLDQDNQRAMMKMFGARYSPVHIVVDDVSEDPH